MKGYEITFFSQEDRLHGRTQISEWLLLAARFFELADNPQEIVMIVSEEESSLFI